MLIVAEHESCFHIIFKGSFLLVREQALQQQRMAAPTNCSSGRFAKRGDFFAWTTKG